MTMTTRRRWLASTFATTLIAGTAPRPAWAQDPRRGAVDPLRVGVDPALMASGLAPAWQRAFQADVGIAVRWFAQPALPLLDALERGELDVAVSNAPEADSKLDAQGLVHDRRAVAGGGFVLVGPVPRGKRRETASRDGTAALQRVHAACAAGEARFVSAGDGSGTHAAEQALWRRAGLAPAAPWYVKATADRSVLAEARARTAYALVERAAWLAQGGTPLGIMVDADPALAEQVHAMRSFRVNHPAAKLFVAWLAGPQGRRVVGAQRGYQLPTA